MNILMTTRNLTNYFNNLKLKYPKTNKIILVYRDINYVVSFLETINEKIKSHIAKYDKECMNLLINENEKYYEFIYSNIQFLKKCVSIIDPTKFINTEKKLIGNVKIRLLTLLSETYIKLKVIRERNDKLKEKYNKFRFVNMEEDGEMYDIDTHEKQLFEHLSSTLMNYLKQLKN